MTLLTKMNLPDRIFAIGGAGKAIAFTLLESDWVLEEVLKPRPNPVSVTITIIDTAEGELNADEQKVRQYRNKIQSKKEELSDPGRGRTGDIDIQFKLVTSELQLNGQIDLLGDDAVPRIAAGNGMLEENWWLKSQHINENLDFAKGVVRKRGLGKAIYYKAYAEDDTISTYIDLPQKGQVAVLCGLGGGTGSGLFLDVVNHLQQKQATAEVTLFGVLPNHIEGIEENTNTFAALSELEYLSLSDENLFKDRILMPIGPTGFGGKKGNRIESDQYLQEFDEAVIYLIASYYNTQGLEDPFAGTPSYAPFTIGIPQILRYNVEAISGAREALREMFTEKEEALDAEEELYSSIDRFLSRQYSASSASDKDLRESDKRDLQNRFEDIEELIGFELFDELEYRSLDTYATILDDARAEGDGIIDQITIAASSVRAGAQSASNQAYVDDIDELLGKLIEQSITLLDHRKELLQRRQVITDNRVQKTIGHLLLMPDESVSAGVQLSRLEGKLEDARDRQDRLESDLQAARDELETLRDERSEHIRRELNEWESAVERDVEMYRRLSDLNVDARLNELHGALETFQNEVVGAGDKEAVEAVSGQQVHTKLDQLENELNDVGIDISEKKQAINSSLPALRRTKKAFLEINQEEGTFEKIAPWKSSTEEQRKEATQDYRMKKNELDDKNVFTVGQPGTSYTADISFNADDVRKRVDRRREDLRASVVSQLRSQLDSVDTRKLEQLESAMESGADLSRLANVVEDALREQVAGTAEVEQRASDLEDELEETTHTAEVYEKTVELFQQLNGIRETCREKHQSFQSKRNEHQEESTPGTRTVSTQESEYVYVKNVKPNDVLRTTGDTDIAQSNLFKNRQESQRLQNNIEELARNARNQNYTGLKRRKFSIGGRRYNDVKIRVGLMSRAVNEMDTGEYNLKELFSGSFDIGNNGHNQDFTTWQRDIGGPWDIGLSVFINGIFLDNLRKVVDADGYFAGYQEQHRQLGDDILVHHSYGLDQGYYVRRQSVLNMEDPDDVEFYLRDSVEIEADLRERIRRVDLNENDDLEEHVEQRNQSIQDERR